MNAAATVPGSGLPDAGASVLRVGGAFIIVIALFLAGVWLFRNWQRLAVRRGNGAKLTLIEARPLGQRQTLYVVGYEQQRMLLASSANGVTLVSHLPAAEKGDEPPPTPGMNFADALQTVLSRKK